MPHEIKGFGSDFHGESNSFLFGEILSDEHSRGTEGFGSTPDGPFFKFELIIMVFMGLRVVHDLLILIF